MTVTPTYIYCSGFIVGWVPGVSLGWSGKLFDSFPRSAGTSESESSSKSLEVGISADSWAGRTPLPRSASGATS